MGLAKIRIDSLRSLKSAELQFSPSLTLIHGENGSGKTSILEAVFLLGRGRSFRTRNTEKLIANGSDELRVFGETQAPAHRIGFEYRRDEFYAARLDGQDVKSLAELPGALFCEVIDPEIHRLVEGAPGERRRWLDWGVFHVEHSFLGHWTRYTRTLRQRNAALRSGQPTEPWDQELAVSGELVARDRAAWFETLKPHVERAVQELSGLELEISHQRGWSTEKTLLEALRANLDRDRQRAGTLSGPHRSDVLLKFQGRPAKDVLSRGQQKLVAAGLVIAILQRLRDQQNTPPTLLLDDPAAELDQERLAHLVNLVRSLNCQLIITALNPVLSSFGQPEVMFHVEQGRVQGI